MSTKVWIDAHSKATPFTQMTDNHVANAIEWCVIRKRSLERQRDDKDPYNTVQAAINAELIRVLDLQKDLEQEQKTRAQASAAVGDPTLAEFVIRPLRDMLVNGQVMQAGQEYKMRTNAGKIELVEYRGAKPVVPAALTGDWVLLWKLGSSEEPVYYSPKQSPQDLQPLSKCDRFKTEAEAIKAGARWSQEVIAQQVGVLMPAAEKKQFVVEVERMGFKRYLDGQAWATGELGKLPRGLVYTKEKAKRFDTEYEARLFAENWNHAPSYRYDTNIISVPAEKYIVKAVLRNSATNPNSMRFLNGNLWGCSLEVHRHNAKAFDDKVSASVYADNWMRSTPSDEEPYICTIEVA